MPKKKEISYVNKPTVKAHKRIFSARFLARVLVINIPAYVVLAVLSIAHGISWETAGVAFIIVTVVTGVITASVFHDLERFINYLRKLSQDEEVEAPPFHRGIFGSMRLLDAFLSVRNRWVEQTISDERILDSLPDPLMMLDDTGKVVFANKMAQEYFDDKMMGKTADDIFAEGDISLILDQVLARQKQSDWFEWKMESDRVYVFRVRAELLPARAKNNGIVVLVFHDITPFRLFEKQQADFFANASHELKTPLSIVSGFIETLQGSAKDDEIARAKFLQMMGDQTVRMTNLVQDLLALSKLQMTNKGAKDDVILIPVLLQSVIQDLSLKAEKHKKKLKLDMPHDLPRLLGNRAGLHQVFQNLIDNAIKYGDEESTVTIRTTLNNNFPKKSALYLDNMRQVIAVSVHNFGPPIPPHNINRLFERFYRLDTLKSKKVEGTGLGLGIVQQIVQKHEGMVDVVSAIDKGTVFTVYLPVNL